MKEKILIELSYDWFERMWSIPEFGLVDKIVDAEYCPNWIYMDEKGPELVKHEIKYFRSIFPDLKFKVTDIINQDEKVWLRYKANGTQKGSFWGFKPTNKFIEFEGVAILHFNDRNQVIDLWESYCFYDILEKLKLVPPFSELHEYL
jgi:hypothetical protein